MVAAVQSRARLWVPVVLWAGLIFGLSSIPGLTSGFGTWDLVLRKLGHAAEFAILGAFLQRATAYVPVAVLLGSAYAVTDELHQRFVDGRVGSPVDWAIDTGGVVVGVLLFLRWQRRR
jgi:VanZ family protein